MKKNILITIISIILIFATSVATFITTMNHLKIVTNETENWVLVECFGQLWYCESEI